MTADVRATAIVAAAGSGERLAAGRPKALVGLAGRPMVVWSVEAMLAAETVGAVVVTAPQGSEPEMRSATSLGSAAPVRMVAGGASRSESVARALEVVETELVVVHDAARPLISGETVDQLVRALLSRHEVDGLILAAHVSDTIKRAREGGQVIRTVARQDLWAIQTPQVFRTEALRTALDVAPATLAAATDDAGLLEAAGMQVVVHPAAEPNLKVTTAADLRIAELLLGERESEPAADPG